MIAFLGLTKFSWWEAIFLLVLISKSDFGFLSGFGRFRNRKFHDWWFWVLLGFETWGNPKLEGQQPFRFSSFFYGFQTWKNPKLDSSPTIRFCRFFRFRNLEPKPRSLQAWGASLFHSDETHVHRSWLELLGYLRL